MERCSKCATPDLFFVKYTNLEETWSLCRVCNAAFDRQTDLLKEFMKEDFGLFPLGQIERSMIIARMNRAIGKGAWVIDGDNKGQDYVV